MSATVYPVKVPHQTLCSSAIRRALTVRQAHSATHSRTVRLCLTITQSSSDNRTFLSTAQESPAISIMKKRTPAAIQEISRVVQSFLFEVSGLRFVAQPTGRVSHCWLPYFHVNSHHKQSLVGVYLTDSSDRNPSGSI
jgi:hypothetical protein